MLASNNEQAGGEGGKRKRRTVANHPSCTNCSLCLMALSEWREGENLKKGLCYLNAIPCCFFKTSLEMCNESNYFSVPRHRLGVGVFFFTDQRKLGKRLLPLIKETNDTPISDISYLLTAFKVLKTLHR